MTSEGMGEEFKGDFADTCSVNAGAIGWSSVHGPRSWTPIGVGGNFSVENLLNSSFLCGFSLLFFKDTELDFKKCPNPWMSLLLC